MTTPLTEALRDLIRGQQHYADWETMEARADAVEQALRALIKKELVIHNLVAERDPVD
jgi:hypothetical protein